MKSYAVSKKFLNCLELQNCQKYLDLFDICFLEWILLMLKLPETATPTLKWAPYGNLYE